MAAINGSAGKDFIHRAGDGRVPPAGYADVIGVTTGADTIKGLGGDDIIFADDGDDTIDGGAGADQMTGGAGNDTYIVDNAGDMVAEVFGGGIDTVQSSINYTLGPQVEYLTLTGAGAINGTGNALDNTITGNSADNVLKGEDGNDTLIGGAGRDTLIGGSGLDTLIGGIGDDRITIDLTGGATDIANAGGDAGDNLILVGNAAFFGSFNVDLSLADQLTSDIRNQSGFNNVDAGAVTGTTGRNRFVGNANANTFIATSGNDSLTGGAGTDKLYGGAGSDEFYINGASDIFAGEIYDGGSDIDTLYANGVASAVDISGVTLTGVEGVYGFFSGLTLAAGQLNGFTNYVQTGAITLSGAGNVDISGSDVYTTTFNLSSAGNRLTLRDEGLAVYTVNGGTGVDTVTILGGTQGTTLNGNGGNDTLIGGGGPDTLNGGDGNDLLTGGAGRDTLRGGANDDTLYINTPNEIVAAEIYDGGSGIDTLYGGKIISAADLTGVTLAGLEHLYGFFYGLTLTAAQLDGFTWSIETGAITVSGAGNTDLTGTRVYTTTFNLSNAGNGLILEDDGLAYYTVNGGSADDTVSVAFFSPGGSGVRFNGNGGNDTLTGGWGRDTLSGGAGNDTLRLIDAEVGEIYDGGGDVDTLEGIDWFWGQVDLSRVALVGLENLSGFLDGVTLTSAQLNSFTGQIATSGDITLIGTGNVDLSNAHVYTTTFNLSNTSNGLILRDEGTGFTVVGGDGNDTVTILGGVFHSAWLRGNGGNDTLTGAAARDILAGGAGDDTLTGGSAADEFGYGLGDNGFDIITDFSGQTNFGGGLGDGDKFTFNDVLHGTFAYRGDQGFSSGGSTEARVVSGGVLVDVDGNGVADILIGVTGLTSGSQLSSADFMFYS